MAEAVLRVRTEGSADVKRALGATVGAVRSAAQAMSADARRAAKDQEAIAKAAAKSAKDAEKAAKDAARQREAAERKATQETKRRSAEERREANRTAAEAKRNAAETARAAAKAESEKTKAAKREAAERKRAADDERRAANRAESEKTKAAKREAAERKREVDREARDKKAAAERAQRDAERSERRQTEVARREAQRRADDRRRHHAQHFGRARDTFAGGVRMGHAAATDIVGQAREARQRVAGGERSVGNAVFQAGGDRAESAARRSEVLALSQRTGLSFEEISSAMLAAQTEFSSLGERGMSRSQRDDRFRDFSRTIEFAASTGNNAGETARLQGMLSQSGFGSDMQDTLMRFAAGASQAGAIELGGLTREGMGSIMRRMADATGALGTGATPAQREAAMAAAFRQQVAAMEVFRGQGQTARNAGNALASMQTALRDPARQDKILGNITSAESATTDPARRAQLAALRTQMFEADPTRRGAQRLRAQFTDPAQFQAALSRAVGNDPTAAANLLAGGGMGNPQSLLSNQRLLLSLMTAQDATGKSGSDRILALQNATLSREDVQRGANIFTNDTQAQLNREETARLKALTDNNNRLVQLAASLDRFRAENAMSAAAARAVGGDVGELVAAEQYASRPSGAVNYGGLTRDQFTEARRAGAARALASESLADRARNVFTAEGRQRRVANEVVETAKEIGARGGSVQQFVSTLSESMRRAVEAALSSGQSNAFNSARAATGPSPVPPEHRSRG